MYSVFPYRETQVSQLKQELSSYKAQNYQEAFQKNQNTLAAVIGSITNNQYLKSQIFDFIDKVINKDTASIGINLNKNAGEQIEKLIDDLYTKPYETTIEEDKALKSEVNIEDEDTLIVSDDELAELDATPLEDQDALFNKANISIERALVKKKLKESQELLDTDSQTYAMQKVILLQNFNDALRLNKTANSKISNVSEEIISENNEWNLYAESFAGGHTLGVNSDSYAFGKDDSKMLGALADGVTTVINENGRSDPGDFLGHYFAKTLSKAVANFDMQAFQGSISKYKASELSSEETKLKVSILSDPSRFLEDIIKSEGFSFNKDLKLGFLDQLINHIKKENPESTIINLLKDNDIRLALTSFAPFHFAEKAVEKSLSSIYPNREKLVQCASTISYAFDYEDQVIAVNMGDSDIAAYDNKGNKIESQNRLRLGALRTAKIRAPLYVNFYLEPSEGVVSELSHNDNIQISSFEKDSFNHLVMASDGVIGRNKLPIKLPIKAGQVIPHFAKELTVKRPDFDDATMMVIEKKS